MSFSLWTNETANPIATNAHDDNENASADAIEIADADANDNANATESANPSTNASASASASASTIAGASTDAGMPAQKRILSVKEKMEVVNVLDKEKLTVRELAKRFNIGKTQAAAIAKNKEEIRLKWQSGINVHQKKNFPQTKGFVLDKLCFEWFARARSQNMPLSRPIVKAKAKEIAHELGHHGFSSSDGWLHRWCKRHNVSFKCNLPGRFGGAPTTTTSMTGSNEAEAVERFMETVHALLVDYRPEDVYSADESGLFFRALPHKTAALRGELCTDGKMSNDRLTVLFCVNMAGQKEDLLVIGNAEGPRGFKYATGNGTLATWRSNKNSWMTRDIMVEWLLQLDRRMSLQQRKILLLVDNAGSHPQEMNLNNVKIMFVPSNNVAAATGAVGQPLQHGVVDSFKLHFREQLVKHVLLKLTNSKKSLHEFSKSVDVLEALYFIKTSWNNVTADCIKESFLKAGFFSSDYNSNELKHEDDLQTSTLAILLRGLMKLGPTDSVQVREYIDIDKHIQTEDINVEIRCLSYGTDSRHRDGSDSADDIELISDDPHPINSYEEALKRIKSLKQFAKDDFTAFQLVQDLESHYQDCLAKQKQEYSKITPIEFHST